jgi:hypothetical protein
LRDLPVQDRDSAFCASLSASSAIAPTTPAKRTPSATLLPDLGRRGRLESWPVARRDAAPGAPVSGNRRLEQSCRVAGAQGRGGGVSGVNVGAGGCGRDQRQAFGGDDPVMSAAGGEPPRILVVDDDPVTNRMVVDYLENRNMRATSASGVCDERRRQRSALMPAKATSSSASAQSPSCFDRLPRTRRAFTVAQDARTGDPAPHNRRESGECRL